MVSLLKWLFNSNDPDRVELTFPRTRLVGDQEECNFGRVLPHPQYLRGIPGAIEEHLETNYIPFTGYDFPSQIAPPDVPLCPSKVRPADSGYRWGQFFPVRYTAVTPLAQTPDRGVTSGDNVDPGNCFLFYHSSPFGIAYWRTGKPLVQFALHPLAYDQPDDNCHRLIVCNYKRLLPTRQTPRYYDRQIGCAFHFVMCPRTQRRYLVGIRASTQNAQWYSKPHASDIVWVKILDPVVPGGLPQDICNRLAILRPWHSPRTAQPVRHYWYTADYTCVMRTHRDHIAYGCCTECFRYQYERDIPLIVILGKCYLLRDCYIFLCRRLCPRRQTPSARNLQLCRQLNPYESSPFRVHDSNLRLEASVPLVAPGLMEDRRVRFDGPAALISANTPEMHARFIERRQYRERRRVPHVAPGLREDV